MSENPRTRKKTDEDHGTAGTGERRSSRATAMSAITILRKAREQFEELTGHSPESISALSRAGAGWEMKAEVVELERVPDTMSLLASYTVTLDDSGDVVGYERTRRYTRGRDDPDC